MSQVLAVTNETEILKAPEQNLSRTSDIDFTQLLEKEKQKLLLPFSFSFLPQIFGTNFQIDQKWDQSVSKIINISAADNDTGRAHKNLTVEKHSDVSKKTEKTTAPENRAGAAKIDRLQLTNNAVNKIFVGELEFSPEFYGALITAKNRTASLWKVDVDDLVSQIQGRIKFLKETGKTELTMELKPDNLGTIFMNISSSRGIVSINIFAGSTAKEALDENLQELERCLKQANLNIGELKIHPEERRKYNNK